ncbi:lysozyme [Acidovorax sp. SDU_ACID1]|uniref:lysozyme n=1 Tax=Acidovorax sp. SDU_ACID1 TaxID=3136632 RepID=UPI00387378A2
MSAVPDKLRASLAALALLTSIGGGTWAVSEAARLESERNAYIQAVATDPTTSAAVKVAMVMGSYYESSGKHIGTPYVDKLGKGQPLTVCNGITGEGVVAGRWYSPGDCYLLERKRYLQAEREAQALLTYWRGYDPFVQGTFIDFVHNKGSAHLAASTMRRKANAGDLAGACRENPRWNRGTVKGVSTVLPGLQLRGDANDEICREWRVGGMP